MKEKKISCSCKYHYTEMSYGMAKKCTTNSPCTNVPIHCPLCPPSASGQPATVWKYNVMYHITVQHSSYDSGSGSVSMPSIPGPYLVESYITSHEEALMGIEDEVTDDWREKNGVPNSDTLEEMYPDAGLKRDRAESSVSMRAKKTTRRF